MRRRLAPPLALAAALAGAAPTSAQTSPPTPVPVPARPVLAARLVLCTTGPDAADRAASFMASMPQIASTKRMWMRFDLVERTSQTGWEPVQVPKWGQWERSDPGRPGFIYTKRVEGLPGPGAYRAVVHFRWYGAGSRLLRSAQRTTKACTQPDPRPDLRAGALTAAAGPQAGSTVYQLVVRNAGLGPAGPFDTTLSVAGSPAVTQRLEGLDAGAQQVVSFTAQRCAPGSTLHFALDARDEVVEVVETDNVVDRPCPF
jgi:hypothetical protein